MFSGVYYIASIVLSKMMSIGLESNMSTNLAFKKGKIYKIYRLWGNPIVIIGFFPQIREQISGPKIS